MNTYFLFRFCFRILESDIALKPSSSLRLRKLLNLASQIEISKFNFNFKKYSSVFASLVEHSSKIAFYLTPVGIFRFINP